MVRVSATLRVRAIRGRVWTPIDTMSLPLIAPWTRWKLITTADVGLTLEPGRVVDETGVAVACCCGAGVLRDGTGVFIGGVPVLIGVVGDGTGVLVGTIGALVGGTGVFVGATGVLVGVFVGGTDVLVGVFVGVLVRVLVGGSGVLVGGTDVLVGDDTAPP